MGRSWTPEQQNAINAESGTILVSAAAGSGKTSVLVERIVRKLTAENNPCAPDELIVVTFTAAAAAEMRYRIHKRLSETAAPDDAGKKRLNSLKSRLDEMQVSTMDAFCMRLVKENFNACGIEPDFSLLEAGENTVLKNTAAAKTVDALYDGQTEGFKKLARLFERGRGDELLLGSIIRLSDFSMSEPDPDKWLSSVADNFDEDVPEKSVWCTILSDIIREKILYAKKLIESALYDIKADETLEKKVYAPLKSDCDAINGFFDMFDSLVWDEKLFAAQKMLLKLKGDGYRSPTGYKDVECAKSAKAKRDKCIALAEDCCKLLCVTSAENKKDLEILRPAARELIAAVKLFNAELFSLKQSENKYDYPDISHFALSLLYDAAAPDGKTDLAREMSKNIREILIDEYQDTNRAQDTLFTCLSRDGLNMFMVGDVKQSIYRFRLASPELFIEKCEAYPYYDGIKPKSKIILSKNFRSRSGVIQNVNFMFSAILSKQCGEIDYSDDEKLNCAAAYPQSGEPDFELHAIENSELSSAQSEGEYIADLIKSKLRQGICVFENGVERPAQYGDFCILLRSAKNTAPVIASAMRKKGIPVFVESKDGFFETAEIRMAFSLLKAIDNPRRDVELLSVMLSPVFGFSPDDVAKVRLDSKQILGKNAPSLYAAVLTLAENGDEKCIDLREKLLYWRRLSATQSAGEFIRSVIYDTSCLQLVQALGEGSLRKKNLLLLCDYAQKYSSDYSKSTGGFIRYLEMLRQNNAALGKACGNGENSVSIMTMHRSKGLEFPFVIIAGLTKEINNQDLYASLVTSHSLGIGLKMREPDKLKAYDTLSSLSVKNDLKNASVSEELRIMYVAMTRAREKLFVVISSKSFQKKLESYSALLPHEPQIPPCCVRGVSFPGEWFLMSFMRHADGKQLRRGTSYALLSEEKAKILFVSGENNSDNEEPADTEPVLPDKSLVEEYRSRLSFTYKYAPAAYSSAKHTASALHRDVFSPVGFAEKKPAFMYDNSLSPVDIGTATHLYLQFCDFNAAALSPRSELERLCESGRLTARQAQSVDLQSVGEFVNSSVMERIKKAEAVYREKRFTMAKSICELDSSVPSEFSDEKSVVIGKIDLLFIENGKAVVVDYKTDNITDVSVLAERYGDQMEIYAEAVKKCMNIDVKESILYSLKLKKYIRL